MIILSTFILTELGFLYAISFILSPPKKKKNVNNSTETKQNSPETVMTVWGNTSILFFFIVRLIILFMLSRDQLFVIPWTVALQTLLFMGFFRQGY